MEVFKADMQWAFVNLSYDIQIAQLHLWGNVGFWHLYYIFNVSVSMPGVDEDIVLSVVADKNSVAPRGTTSLHISAKNHKQF